MCHTVTVLRCSDKGDSSVEEVSMPGGRAATAAVSRTSEKRSNLWLELQSERLPGMSPKSWVTNKSQKVSTRKLTVLAGFHLFMLQKSEVCD